MLKLKFSLLLLLPLLVLQGCATAIVTGAATGVSIAHDRRSAGAVIDDQGIEFKASFALFNNKEIYDQSHINITSYNGSVLITGETPSEDLKQKVSAEIKAIDNVRRIHNELFISAPSALPSRSSDTWITSKIKAKLTTAEGIDPFYVKVVTEHGIVYLMGILSHSESDKVESVVTQAAGVQRVIKIFEYTD
jgi:osmotically-inducible protein OsmY